MRQKIRNTIIWIVFLAFPIILNFFSPYLSLSGSFQGIISGSLALFGILFLFSLLLGRAFCGWVCPVGCFQDISARINNKSIHRHHWIKYLVWVPWFSFIVIGFISAGGIKKIDILYMTENGISVSEPLQFITYYMVIFIFLILALAIGRHAICRLRLLDRSLYDIRQETAQPSQLSFASAQGKTWALHWLYDLHHELSDEHRCPRPGEKVRYGARGLYSVRSMCGWL